jgi:hypothetical protein
VFALNGEALVPLLDRLARVFVGRAG